MASSSSPTDPRTRTVVLVGKTGNGKSATANSLAGDKIFKSVLSMKSVTTDIKLAESERVPGKPIVIIDTPGLFDTSVGHEEIGKKIVKCVEAAQTGIHAVLLVLSVKNRFSEEEEAAILCLQCLFGSKIFEYVIVVFTGGDNLEEDTDDVDGNIDMNSLNDFVNKQSPKNLKDILHLCHHRKVLFDNKTKDKSKQSEQVNTLLRIVDEVLEANDGEPYTQKWFGKQGNLKLDGKDVGYQAEINSMKAKIQKTYDLQLMQITEKMEADLKVRNRILELEKESAGNEVAKLIAEVNKMSQTVNTYKEMVKASKQREDEARNAPPPQSDGCLIL